jgi:uncharacterized protein
MNHSGRSWSYLRLVVSGGGTVMVISKQPVPGRVKTRLCPPLSHNQAAALAGVALRDTVAAVDGCVAQRRVAVFEGNPEGWIPEHWEVVPQRTGGLDVRLADAFDDVLGQANAPAILIAMDTPQVAAAQLDNALRCLDSSDAVIGLTPDGGYWLIGLRAANRAVFEGVPMSTDHTGDAQLERLSQLGMSVSIIEQLFDLDTIAELQLLSERFPDLQTAATWRAQQLETL